MTVWVMVLLAMSQHNPEDIPGRVTIEFSSQHLCEQALRSMTYQLKFTSYKVTGQCERK